MSGLLLGIGAYFGTEVVPAVGHFQRSRVMFFGHLLEAFILHEYGEYVKIMQQRFETEMRRKAAENVLPLAIEEQAVS
jgi:hypothetical protein